MPCIWYMFMIHIYYCYFFLFSTAVLVRNALLLLKTMNVGDCMSTVYLQSLRLYQSNGRKAVGFIFADGAKGILKVLSPHWPSSLFGGGAVVSSTSLVIERVMRPLRRPWLLAVRRPLKATVGSLSSASSPEVSSLLKCHKELTGPTQSCFSTVRPMSWLILEPVWL